MRARQRRASAPTRAALDADPADVDALAAAAARRGSTSWSSGPEAPLVAGLVDACAAAGVRAASARAAAAAALEGSKAYAKEVMLRRRRADRRLRVVTDVERGAGRDHRLPGRDQGRRARRRQGRRHRRRRGGGGEALEEMLVERRFGDAPVLVEQFLAGERGLAAGAVRRRAGGPARPGARLQAHRRRGHRARTRAGWARSRPSPRSPTTFVAGDRRRPSTSPCSTSSRAAARRSTASSTPG